MTVHKIKPFTVGEYLALADTESTKHAAEHAKYVAEVQRILREAVAKAAASLKFKKWTPPAKNKKAKLIGHEPTKEMPHFTPSHLARAWGLSVDTIRRLFENERGVLKLGNPDPKYKRRYVSLRIPSDVAERVHRKLSASESRRRES